MNECKKPVIMVVDDDIQVLYTVAALIAAAGFKVVKFNQPQVAVEALNSQEFDLVISDIKMPGITGLELLDIIKQESPDTPLIFMTGQADLEVAIQAIKRGAFEFLTKPLDYEMLKIAIDKALKIRNARLLEASYQQRLENDLLTRTAELRSSLERLEFTSSQLAAAEEAKDIFLSTISHELRTPMNGIVGSLSLLSDTVCDPEQRQLVDIASQSALGMCNLVDKIINFSVVKSGKERAAIARFFLRKRIEASLDCYREICRRRGIGFRIAIDDTVHEELKGNLESYLLVLDSLISNSVKFTESGEIRVVVSNQNADEEKILVKTSIHDTGIGIPEERHASILQEFSQGDGSYTRAYGGLGIGLNTALLVAQKAGGHLWFESRAGEGSDFHFTFPFKSILI